MSVKKKKERKYEVVESPAMLLTIIDSDGSQICKQLSVLKNKTVNKAAYMGVVKVTWKDLKFQVNLNLTQIIPK